MDQHSLPLNEEIDPILLELGSALFVCQGFEGTLVFFLSIRSMEDANMEDGALEAARDMWSQKTLGQLLKSLRERVNLSDELAQRFREGWDARNWVVHRFLHDTVEDFATPKGRLSLRRRLAVAKSTVQSADEMANQLLASYVERFGISLADARVRADMLWDYLNPAPSESVTEAHDGVA